MAQAIPVKYTAEEWEYFRKRFFNSMLNDTQVAALGQNVGVSWPFKGSDETPAKYIEFDFEELKSVPGLIGKMARIKKLMDILRETLAFDDPFSDMVETVDAETAKDNAFERILTKLEIPSNYPASLIHFSAETEELLKAEGIETLLQAIQFAQNLARTVVIGGDLKSFLNSLVNTDMVNIIKHLPYRSNERSLHLAEAVGLIVRDLDESVQLELLSQVGVSLTDDEEEILKCASPIAFDKALKTALVRFDALCKWFTEEATDLELICTTSGSVERYFMPMNEPRLERVAAMLARAKFGNTKNAGRGLFGKISGLFGR